MFLPPNKKSKERVSMERIIYQSEIIFKQLKELKLGLFLSDVYLKHLMSIITSVFIQGYKGKTVNFEQLSVNHRTTISHFLNQGKWNDEKLQKTLKEKVINTIYNEAEKTGKPIFCIVDDTIASHTKPSSQAMHPIEAAYFHQSHLKKKQDYGHQAVSVILSCNDINLNYTTVMYDKSKSKIDIVRNIADELPEVPVISYFLCDSWYTTSKVLESFIKKGFYTIGALKTNRIIYPNGIRTKVSDFATMLNKADPDVNLVTVGNRQFYVKKYEGKLNGIDNAIVLITYPKEAFLNPKALRVFISTNTSLKTQEILDLYVNRWTIEVFFRQSKNILAFDKYQVRKQLGIRRYWLIMSLVHFICCTFQSDFKTFDAGFKNLKHIIQSEFIAFIYNGAKNGISLNSIIQSVA